MAKNTSILLGDHFDSFIGKQIRSGRYTSASEIIREALRRFEKEEQTVELLELLEEGERSGFIDFNPEENLAELHKDHLKK
ncbi:MAG: type II toxin-antitoxin system ParD family antitoxin [Acidobacteria bacterium]|nr:type II toxin-antitoxin system ParD family antitoxin [Acidobacteriota bacterium]